MCCPPSMLISTTPVSWWEPGTPGMENKTRLVGLLISTHTDICSITALRSAQFAISMRVTPHIHVQVQHRSLAVSQANDQEVFIFLLQCLHHSNFLPSIYLHQPQMDVVMSDVKSRTSGYLYSATWWSFCLYLTWCFNCDKLSPQCICGVTEVDTQLLLRWWTSSGRTRYCCTALYATRGIINLSKLID